MLGMARKKKWEGETVMLSIKLPKKLSDDARKKSDETGLPLSFVVREAIRRWTYNPGPLVVFPDPDAPADSDSEE